MDDHEIRVRAVQESIRHFYDQKAKVKIFHGSTNSTRPFSSGGQSYVDVSDLGHVIEINKDERYIVVEPNAALDQLVDATLAHGLIPPVVAEFPGITVGGAIQGGSGESSSFRHGGFHDACLEYEIVLGNGDLVTASPGHNSDLFWGMSCAYGSLGVITRVKIGLIPATSYVRLKYIPVSSYQEAVSTIKTQSAGSNDFVDGILFSPTSGVIMVGQYTDKRDNLSLAQFHRARDEWFYIHAERITSRHDEYEEVIPLRDYLFRYDRGGFWVAKYGSSRVPINRITRFIFAGLFKTRTLYRLLQGSNYSYRYLVQDICLPQDKVVAFLEFAHECYGIYPLWLCPLKPAGEDALSPNALETDLVINVGIWGPLKSSSPSFVEQNRQLERQVEKLGGRKVLYAHSYYTRDEFWKIYDKEKYEKLRTKYNASVTFRDVFDKTATPPSNFRPSKLRGVLALFKSPYKMKP